MTNHRPIRKAKNPITIGNEAKAIQPSQLGLDSQHTAGTLQNSSMILFITDIITEIRGK